MDVVDEGHDIIIKVRCSLSQNSAFAFDLLLLLEVPGDEVLTIYLYNISTSINLSQALIV